MRPTARAAATLAACAALAGCGAPFRAGTRVDVEKRWYGTTYRQDGRNLGLPSLLDGLEQVEASREDARAARRYVGGGLATTVVGGFGLGYGLGAAQHGEGDAYVALAVAGAAVLAAGGVLYWTGVRRLDRAVEAYDAQLATPAPRAALAPWLAPVRGARADRCVAGGIAVRF